MFYNTITYVKQIKTPHSKSHTYTTFNFTYSEATFDKQSIYSKFMMVIENLSSKDTA